MLTRFGHGMAFIRACAPFGLRWCGNKSKIKNQTFEKARARGWSPIRGRSSARLHGACFARGCGASLAQSVSAGHCSSQRVRALISRCVLPLRISSTYSSWVCREQEQRKREPPRRVNHTYYMGNVWRKTCGGFSQERDFVHGCQALLYVSDS